MELKELEVLRVKPGDVLVLRPTNMLTMDQMECLRDQIEAIAAKTGVRFVLIEYGLEIVGVQERETAYAEYDVKLPGLGQE